VELVKAQNEVTATTLNKIGLIKVNDDQWICKADYDSPDEQPGEEEEGDATDVDEGHDDPITDAPPNGYENYFVGFEERMMTQLHTMHDEERSHHQYCETRLQNIEGTLEDVQFKLGQMFYSPNE